MNMKTKVTPQPNGISDYARRGFLARICRAVGLESPSHDKIRRRIRSKPGIIESLTPEALEYLRNYDGPEVHGPPLTRRERRDLERRMASWRRE